jgi:hypothetical protein
MNTGVRILQAATTANLASQSSTQNVSADDSFVGILNAVSEEQVSVRSVVGDAAKEEAGQDSASRGTGKQAEAPPVQKSGSSREFSSRALYVISDVRVQPAATVPTPAPQPLVQNAPAADSLVVLLNAVSKQPDSAHLDAGHAAKGQADQSSVSRGVGKQVGEQAPPVQNNEGSRASALPSRDHRAKSFVDETSGDQGNLHPLTSQLSSVVIGLNSSSTLYGSRFQAPTVSAVPSAVISTPPIAPPIIWSTRAFYVPIAGLSHLPSPGERLISPGTQTQTDYRVANGKSSDQAVPQLPAFHESGSTIDATAIVPPIQGNAPDVVQSPVQENDQSSKDGSSAASAGAANGHVSMVARDLSHLQVSQAPSNAAAQERTPSTQDPLASAAPPDPTASSDSTAPVALNVLTDLAAGPVESAAGTILQQSMALPISSAIPNKQSGIELASSITQRADSDAIKSRNSDLASTANSGSSKASGDAALSSDIPTHTSQGAQTDPSPNAMSTSRVQDVDASHPQAQPAVSHVVSHESTIAPRIADTPAEASQLSPRREAGPSIESDTVEAMATSGINAAKLIQTMSESEMRVGLSSSTFGDISIRTSISNHQMLAQISLDHSELSQAISSHVSSVQTKLGDEYGLRASIEVNNLASPHSGEPGHPSRREKATPDGSLPAQTVTYSGEEGSNLSQEGIVSAGNETRLDIRA